MIFISIIIKHILRTESTKGARRGFPCITLVFDGSPKLQAHRSYKALNAIHFMIMYRLLQILHYACDRSL